jgi:DNA-binding MarR family transcriptional regulator
MKIAEFLQKGHFQNPYHKLRINLLHTAHWLNGQICNFLDPFEITQQQFNILRILRGQFPEAISTLDIRERMIISGSDTSRLVDRLQAKGLVEKENCKHDKRKVDVKISNKGLQLLSSIDEKIEMLDKVFKLSEEEASALNELLLKMQGQKAVEAQTN